MEEHVKNTISHLRNINPLDVVLGIAVGAGGAIAAVHLYTVVQNGNRKPKAKVIEKTQRLPSMYNSPGPITDIDNMRMESRLLSSSSNGRTLRTPSTPVHRFLSVVDERIHDEPEPVDVDEEQNKKEAETLLSLLYAIGEEQSRQDNIIHRGISCNMCGMNPLCGIRFKCVNCVDYDVCSRCEPTSNHNKTHMFVKISTPIPPLANPRSTMLPKFYPGKNNLPSSLPWKEVLRLRDETHFDSAYIEVLYNQFAALCIDEKGITREVFQTCLGPLTSKKNLVVRQLYSFYDHDQDGVINFEDFVRGMSVLTKGSKEERLKHIFNGYDLDGDGFISREDLLQMLQAYHQLSMEIVRDVVRSCEEEMMSSYDVTGNRPISAVFNAPIPDTGNAGVFSKQDRTESVSDDTQRNTLFHSDNNPDNNNATMRKKPKNHERLSAVEAMTQDAIVELVDQIMQNADTDRDGKLSDQEFYQYAVIDTSLMAWFEAIDTVF